MKKVLKITIILMIIFTLFAQINNVYAEKKSELEETEKYKGYDTKWSDKSTDWWKPSDDNILEDELTKRANVITTVIRNVGIILSVIVLMIIGIKEMTASVEEKSVIKQALPGYLIGVIMVVAITTLPSIIYSLVKDL